MRPLVAGDKTALAQAQAALPGLPQLHSLSGAPVSIYIDFNGGVYNSKTFEPYDTDGDETTFSTSEQSDITSCWKDISTYYAQFDVDVTTVKPSGPTAWDLISNSTNGGVSGVGAFPDGSTPASHNQSSDARGRTSGIAHELGHNFGLGHQSSYDNLGNQTAEYSNGYDATHGPIMGVDYARSVHKFFIGHPNSSASSLQDDLKIITNAIKTYEGSGGDGYRADDFGGTIATATAMVGTATFTDSGIIERPTDVDAFSFSCAGGYTTIDIDPTGVSALAPKVEVYDSSGKLVASKDDTSFRGDVDNDVKLTIDAPSSGTYYLLVSGHGGYDDQGQYSATVRQLPDGWQTQDVGGVAATGYATFVQSSGIYTVAGSGSDIAGTADEFRYAYVPFKGDATIIARVTQVQTTNDGAKVGIMVRDSLSAGSVEASVVATSNNGVRFIDRATSGGSTANTGAGGAFATIWLKLTRVGDLFTGYKSTDGVTYTKISQATVPMSANNFIGLATTSHADGTINVGKLDNLSLTGNVNPPPTFNALLAPTGFTVTPDSASDLDLAWNAIAGATGYVIESSIDGYNFSQIGTTKAAVTTFVDDKPFGSMRWYYRVSASDATGNSAPSKIVSAINTPNAVASLSVASLSKSQLVLNWIDASGETGYRIERSTDGATFTTLTTTAKNIPSYSDTGLKAGTTYTYRITPVNAQGDGVPKTINGTTRVGAATSLAFVDRASDHVTISWKGPTGATGYHVERSTDGTDFTTLTDVNDPQQTYTDNTVSPLKDYYYRITAFNAVTDGDPSAVIWGATPGPVALPTPDPWASTDIGNPDGLGANGYASGKLTILANGADIGGTADTFHFVYMPLFGDGQIIARVASLENTDPGAEAGVMIRDSLASNSKVGFLEITAASGLALLYRNNAGDAMSKTGSDSSIVAPYWLKLVRAGTQLTGYDSVDGNTWTQVASIVTALGNAVFIGVAATSHSVAEMNTSAFTDINIANAAPTVATVAKASPKPVTAKTTTLTVLGADDHGEPALSYDWSVTQAPAGGSVSFSDNDTNTAKTAIATFNKAGSYQLTATITDTSGLSVTSAVTLNVNQTVTGITVSPDPVTVATGGTQLFSAVAVDQFGDSFNPASGWTTNDADASISAAGQFTAGTTTGNFTVTATSGGVSDSASVTVAAAPVVTSMIVDDGTSQRSSVRSLTVIFDRAVTLDADAITVTARAGATSPTVTITPAGDNKTFVLTFIGAGIIGGSLADGLYDLTVTAAKIHNASAPTITMAADSTLTFHRFFGDFNGDRTVNNGDAFQFNKSYLKSTGTAGFVAAFDYNGDGTVNNGDSFQFNKRYLQPFNFT